MDFSWTQSEQQFRGEVRQFLKEHLPDEPDEWRGWSEEFSLALAKKNWVALPWPKEWGGLGVSHMHQVIFNQEMAYWRAPIGAHRRGVFYVGPTLMLFGSEEQKAHHLPAITSGTGYYCQLFSEPGAGSDLASAQTRARRDGDDYVVSGQKIWTSDAHRADFGWLVARTDPDAPKHKGLSTIIIDMKSPGVSVRPLVNMANNHAFNEVFFDEVRVPASNLVGAENRGWYHAAATLDFERSSIAGFAGIRRTLDDMKLALPKPLSSQHRGAVADLYVSLNVGEMLSFQIASMQDAGRVPNKEASAAKLMSSELNQRVAVSGARFFGLGAHTVGGPGAISNGTYGKHYLMSAAATIGGGTSEIQRNVIATRGLGLPRG
jgi:alkylation response protein AidB-like acyl-CoA dehydrogenase